MLLSPTLKSNTAQRTLRFSAWNTPHNKLTEGKGWKGEATSSKETKTEKVPQSKDSNAPVFGVQSALDHLLAHLKEAAQRPSLLSYHEIGHFLMLIALGKLDRIRTVKVDQAQQNGVVEFQVTQTEQTQLNPILDLSLIHGGGQAMERLIYGIHDPSSSVADTANIESLNRDARLLALGKSTIAAISGLPVTAEAHLKQYDRDTVDTLAKRLDQEKEWDRERIQALSQEFKLAQVPSALMKPPTEAPTSQLPRILIKIR